jgi:hypothetical protein
MYVCMYRKNSIYGGSILSFKHTLGGSWSLFPLDLGGLQFLDPSDIARTVHYFRFSKITQASFSRIQESVPRPYQLPPDQSGLPAAEVGGVGPALRTEGYFRLWCVWRQGSRAGPATKKPRREGSREFRVALAPPPQGGARAERAERVDGRGPVAVLAEAEPAGSRSWLRQVNAEWDGAAAG